MINNKELLRYEYYLKRMTLFLNNSYGIKERVQFLVQILNLIDEFYNNLFDYLNLMDPDYTSKYLLEDPNTNNMLDKLGHIFDCPRSQTILAKIDSETGEIVEPFDSSDLLDAENVYITLNNEEYLLYIKTQIIKQHFAGTREELAEIYAGTINSKYNSILKMQYVRENGEANANITIYWDPSTRNFSPEFKWLFLNNKITIESLGIAYDKIIQDPLSEQGYFEEVDTIPESRHLTVWQPDYSRDYRNIWG